MSYLQGEYPLAVKRNLAKNIYDFTIRSKELADLAEPGQFVHLRVPGFFLRRPISICGIDREAGTIRLVFEVRGEGTEALAKLNAGELVDVMGPLGKGFTLLPKGKKAIVIGGGIGVPPMLGVASAYGADAKAIVGFRNAQAVILTEDFKKVGSECILCTDDGSMGIHGFVTTALKAELEKELPDLICACGPAPMLKGIITMADEYGVACEVSLEERMGCGVGACLVCACRTVKDGKEYMAHVCKDGPVFDAHDVIL